MTYHTPPLEHDAKDDPVKATPAASDSIETVDASATPHVTEARRPRHTETMTATEAGTWSLVSYLGSFVIGFLSPLIVWLTLGDRNDTLRKNAVECLNFQLFCLLGLFVGLITSLVLVGIPILLFFAVYSVAYTIVGAVKTSDGTYYRIPITVRFIKA